ncbi:MAG: FliM/FliN family flagellar motor switch protein [Balneolaceae bacterium]|nr:FliM/FliN family flagellar motor switch protein [Balneolaceae bacterium]
MGSQTPNKKKGKVKFVVPYDFRRPKLFSKEIMRTIGQIHDTIARGLGRIYSTSLNYKVDVAHDRIEQFSSDDFTKDLPSPAVIYVLNGKHLGGEIIVSMPPEFCIHIIERQSGGPGIDLSHKRVLTTIEEKIISRIMESIKEEIRVAWEPYLKFEFDKSTYENKPDNLHFASVDPTLSAKIMVDLGVDKIEVGVSYSYAFLKRALNDSIIKKDRGANLERLNNEAALDYRRTLKKAPVKIQPLLGTTTLSLDDILSLKEGDTIPLRQKADEPLDIKVNGVAKMNGYPGLKQGRKAIKVFDIIEEINEQELV